MISSVLALSLCAAPQIDICPTCQSNEYYQQSFEVLEYNARLSDDERNQIWQELHFAIKKMNLCLDKADREASQITNVNIRSATKAAIQGCICSASSRNGYVIAVAGCLSVLADIAGNSYDHFVRAQDHVADAERYAEIADEMQGELWRG